MFFIRARKNKQNLPNSVSSGKIGNSLSTKIFPYTSSEKKIVTSGYLAQLPSSRSSLIGNWETLTNDPTILKLMKGYRIPFLSESVQHLLPRPVLISQEESTLMNQKVQKMVQNGAIKPISKFSFCNSEEGFRPLINLKKLNHHIPFMFI